MPQLPEARRAQLDDIVGKMEQANESPEEIKAVIDDFKQQYSKAEWSDIGSNLLPSAGRLLKDTVTGAGAVLKLGTRMHQATMGGNVQELAKLRGEAEQLWQHKGEIGTALKDAAVARYKPGENLKNTIITDPFGIVSDVASVALPIAGGALKATKIPQAVSAAGKIAAFADAVDLPAQAMKAAAPIVKRAGSGVIQLGIRPSGTVQKETGRTSREIAEIIQRERLGSEVGAEAKINPAKAHVDTLTKAATEAGETIDPTVMIDALKGEPMRRAKLRADLGEPEDLNKVNALIEKLQRDHFTAATPGAPPHRVVTPDSPDAVDAAVRNTNELGVNLAEKIPGALYGQADPAAVEGARQIGNMANIVPRRMLGESVEPGRVLQVGEGIPRTPPQPIPMLPDRGLDLKREGQSLAFERGRGNETIAALSQRSLSTALKEALEGVGPEGAMASGNERVQDLMAGKTALGAAEARSHQIENMLAMMGTIASAAFGSHEGLAASIGARALASPRAAAVTGIAAGDMAKFMGRPDVQRLVAQLRAAGASDRTIDDAIKRGAGGGQ